MTAGKCDRGMRSLRQKLLLFILPLCLIPLIGISFFSYFQAKERITQDRIVLYLEQIALGVADTIELTLLEKLEETISMGLILGEHLTGRETRLSQSRVDRMIAIHEVYDLIILFDIDGRIVLTNSVDRNGGESPNQLDPRLLERLKGQDLTEYTPLSAAWLQAVRSGRNGYVDWHPSPLVHQLYPSYTSRDIAWQYNVGFAAPVWDEKQGVVGGILTLMNWEFIQQILDLQEEELYNRALSSGYAFLFNRDGDTIIGHKYRAYREYENLVADELANYPNNYGTSLIRDHGLTQLAAAVRALIEDPVWPYASSLAYEYPANTPKISGLAAINHEHFTWVCGVGINDEEIFAPVQDLKNVLVLAAVFSSLLVVVLTFWVASQITTPLKKLTVGASIIAGGDLSQRVSVSSRDETGELAHAFNEMARSLEERSQALIDLNRRLEQKVEERTRELQQSHRQVEEAYQELKDTQVQLIQSEKMASLGQLVAGIAHEIKNPLNFLYGNTDFLKKYITHLKELLALYDDASKEASPLREEAREIKKRINYDFILEDLDTLIVNFEEGTKRIHAIISDLRAFSRMDSDEFRSVDVHEPIEQALNLVRHEYRDRIKVHRDYAEVPPLACHAGKLSQVFMNLLANACQAIDGQGEIWIRSSRRNGSVVIDIEDSGPGIPPENLNKVFEPFFTTKPGGEGTGLGLSISYGIIQQHKGSISVENRPEGGARFRIELPVKS